MFIDVRILPLKLRLHRHQFTKAHIVLNHLGIHELTNEMFSFVELELSYRVPLGNSVQLEINI